MKRLDKPWDNGGSMDIPYVCQHQEQSGHRWNNNPIMDKIKVLDKERRDSHKKLLEAVHIKQKAGHH